MTKQEKNSKQHIPTLPDGIRKIIEGFWGPITSVSYCGKLLTEDGSEAVRVPTFVMNGTHYVFVHDAEKEVFYIESIVNWQNRRKEFGKNVSNLMDKYGFSWELGKAIVSHYSTESRTCQALCELLQEVKEDISCNCVGFKEQFVNEPKQTVIDVIRWYSINHWLDTRKPHIYNALKEYLFADK